MKDPLRDKVGAELPEPPYITGGPPYPRFPTDDGKFGISILDYFAAHVIQGLAARQNMSIDDLKNDGPGHAYWVAALMVDLRGRLPIESTPPPPPILPEEPVTPLAPPIPKSQAHLETKVKVGQA